MAHGWSNYHIVYFHENVHLCHCTNQHMQINKCMYLKHSPESNVTTTSNIVQLQHHISCSVGGGGGVRFPVIPPPPLMFVYVTELL